MGVAFEDGIRESVCFVYNWLDYINFAYLAVLLTKECIIELILPSFRKKQFTKLVYKQIGEALQGVK